MALRTFVSFEADFPAHAHPAGREVANVVSAVFRDAGLQHEPPHEREGWAWTIWAEREFTRVEIIVGYADDGPRQWLITMYGHVSMARGLAVGGSAEERLEQALAPFCYALDRAFEQDPRFRNVRWYSQEEFDLSHGESWSSSP